MVIFLLDILLLNKSIASGHSFFMFVKFCHKNILLTGYEVTIKVTKFSIIFQ